MYRNTIMRFVHSIANKICANGPCLQVTEYSSGGKRTSVSSSEDISADQVLTTGHALGSKMPKTMRVSKLKTICFSVIHVIMLIC